MNKILLSVAMLALIGVVSFGATRAFFSDTETSAGNVFAAGSLDLLVGINADDSQWPVVEPRNNNNEQLFAIDSLMPGQQGTGEFRLISEGADAWACMAAEITANPENTRLPQELAAGDYSSDSNSGELKNYMEVAIWEGNPGYVDGLVGPNEIETLQVMSLEDFASGDFYTLQDSSANGGDNPLVAGTEYQHEFAYCFGSFERDGSNDPVVNGDNQLVCDGDTASNVAQTDGVEVLLTFYAEQMENNANFVCGDLNPAFVLDQTSPGIPHNEENEDSGWPFVSWVINGDEIEFTFENPTAIAQSFYFDYQVDGQTGSAIGGVTGVVIPSGRLADGIRQWTDFYNFVVLTPGETEVKTVTGTDEIRVRLMLGPERDYDIDWITFELQN